MADAAETVNDLSKDAKFMDLYSRQIGTYGMEAMLKLVRMKVLLVGVRGVGVETAKNATLAGIHTLTLYAVRVPRADWPQPRRALANKQRSPGLTMELRKSGISAPTSSSPLPTSGNLAPLCARPGLRNSAPQARGLGS
jgi:hypothetical protein